jgi:hypothetical protein
MVRHPFGRSQLGAIARLMILHSSSSGSTFLVSGDRNRHNAGSNLLTCGAWWVHSSRSGRIFLGEPVPYSAPLPEAVFSRHPVMLSGGVDLGSGESGSRLDSQYS